MTTRTVHARRRSVALSLFVIIAGVVVIALAYPRDEQPAKRGPLPPKTTRVLPPVDPLRYDASRRADYERHAALGLSHVIYAKTPGGVVASAARTERFRPLIDKVARRHHQDPDTLAAIVMLESAGRPDVIAGDLNGAVGLTQILAETGQNLLGLHIDVSASQRLTRGIDRGTRVLARQKKRMRVDERFDPAKALEATAKYLDFAKGKLGGRLDLAVESYHMGVGNLQTALARYGKGNVPYAQLYFDSSPVRNFTAWRKLASLGDDSATYYWRVLAAKEILRLYRRDRMALADLAVLQSHKASSEEVLHPEATTPPYGDGGDIQDAIDSGELVPLDPARMRQSFLRIDPRMGALAAKVDSKTARYRALRPQALNVLEALGRGVERISGTKGGLIVTSSVRDTKYQRALISIDAEATQAFSLHTTGWAFDLARVYRSSAQSHALQFMLDRMSALGLIAWVREPRAIHVTVATR